MPEFFDAFTSGNAIVAAVGGAGWELIRQLGAKVIKRTGDKVDLKRKLVRDDLIAAGDCVGKCLDAAIDYHTGKHSPERKAELGGQVRHHVQTLAHMIRQTNLGLKALNEPELGNWGLIAFRQSVTMQLDRRNAVPVLADSSEIIAMYRDGHRLQGTFASLKYQLT